MTIDAWQGRTAKPPNITHYCLGVHGTCRCRIGIVKTQVTRCTVDLVCKAKVEADGFGMAYVQVTIRLWRKAQHNSALVSSIALKHRPNKIRAHDIAAG